MILDTIGNAGLYHKISPHFPEAFRFLVEVAPTAAPGRYEIRGDEVYATIADYKAKPLTEVKLEAHRKYIDIQAILEGDESIPWAPLEDLAVTEAYDPARDVAFLARSEAETLVRLLPGRFAIFLPKDAHAPGGGLVPGTAIRKVVVKVRIEGGA